MEYIKSTKKIFKNLFQMFDKYGKNLILYCQSENANKIACDLTNHKLSDDDKLFLQSIKNILGKHHLEKLEKLKFIYDKYKKTGHGIIKGVHPNGSVFTLEIKEIFNDTPISNGGTKKLNFPFFPKKSESPQKPKFSNFFGNQESSKPPKKQESPKPPKKQESPKPPKKQESPKPRETQESIKQDLSDVNQTSPISTKLQEFLHPPKEKSVQDENKKDILKILNDIVMDSKITKEALIGNQEKIKDTLMKINYRCEETLDFLKKFTMKMEENQK